MKKYKEKIGNQLYETTVEVNGSKKDIPLLGRIFGTKKASCDQKWDDEIIIEIRSIIYKGIIYIYKEIITTRVKINNPKNFDHSIDAVRYNQELHKKILITTNPEPNTKHWIHKYLKKLGGGQQ